MGDQDLNIKITTQAQTEGAKQAADSLKNLGREANPAADGLKQLGVAAGETDKKHKFFGMTLRELKHSFHEASSQVPILGQLFMALKNPIMLAGAAIASVIAYAAKMRAEYKEFLAEADKNSQESLAKIQANISAHIQSVNALEVALRNAGTAAKDLGKDLADYLELTSAEESGAIDILNAKEQMANARAEKQFANDPAALAEAKGKIKLDYAEQRFTTKKSYEDQRLQLKESQIAKMAAEEPAAKQRARDMAAALGPKPDVAEQMKSYDALVAAAEKEFEEASQLSGPIHKFDPEKYRAARQRYKNIKERRPEVEGAFQKQAAAWEQKNSEAQAAKAYAESLTPQRQALEREADKDRIRLGITRPDQTASHAIGQYSTRLGTATAVEKARQEAAEKAEQQRKQITQEFIRQAGPKIKAISDDREFIDALNQLVNSLIARDNNRTEAVRNLESQVRKGRGQGRQ